MKSPNRILLSFPRRLRAIANEMAAAANAIGRNKPPSVSELLTRLAIAYEYSPSRWMVAWAEMQQLYAEAMAVDGEVMPADNELEQ